MTSTRSSRRKNRKRKSRIKIVFIFLLLVATFVSSYLITSSKLSISQKKEEKIRVKVITPMVKSQAPNVVK